MNSIENMLTLVIVNSDQLEVARVELHHHRYRMIKDYNVCNVIFFKFTTTFRHIQKLRIKIHFRNSANEGLNNLVQTFLIIWEFCWWVSLALPLSLCDMALLISQDTGCHLFIAPHTKNMRCVRIFFFSSETRYFGYMSECLVWFCHKHWKLCIPSFNCNKKNWPLHPVASTMELFDCLPWVRQTKARHTK